MGKIWKAVVLAAAVGTVILLVVQMPLPEEPIVSEQPNVQPSLRTPDPVPTAATEPQHQVPSVPPVPSNPEAQASASSAGAEQGLSAPPLPDEPKAGGTGPDSTQAQAPAAVTYVVQGGDTPGSIARRYYGDATRWPEIARANPGLKTTSLHIGQVLLLTPGPGPTPNPQPAAIAEKPTTAPAAPGAPLAVHRVGPGDSLYKIARKYYGDSTRWKLIRDANPQLERGGVRGLRLNSELTIPALPQANP